MAESSRDKYLGAEVLGLHIEGPYINSERAGAQSGSQIRPIDMFELKEIYKASKKSLRIVTLAPELTGALDAISWLNEKDILVAGGHSNATFDEAINGITVGMRHATHLFNGMRILHHREPGIVGATLYDDRVTVELIADNFHIHPAIVKIVVKIKSVNKTSLVSDSIVGAGLPDGKYEFGGMIIIVQQGKSFLKSGILAGSTIRLCDAVKNMVQKYGFCLQNAVEMASTTPAKIIGISHRKGYLAPGMDADITVLDQGTHVGGDRDIRLTNQSAWPDGSPVPVDTIWIDGNITLSVPEGSTGHYSRLATTGSSSGVNAVYIIGGNVTVGDSCVFGRSGSNSDVRTYLGGDLTVSSGGTLRNVGGNGLRMKYYAFNKDKSNDFYDDILSFHISTLFNTTSSGYRSYSLQNTGCGTIL